MIISTISNSLGNFKITLYHNDDFTSAFKSELVARSICDEIITKMSFQEKKNVITYESNATN